MKVGINTKTLTMALSHEEAAALYAALIAANVTTFRARTLGDRIVGDVIEACDRARYIDPAQRKKP